MRNALAALVVSGLAVLPAAASPQALSKTASEIRAEVESGLRGTDTEQYASDPAARWNALMDASADAKGRTPLEWFLPPSLPEPQPLPAGTVSAKSLRHSIPKAARKLTEHAQKLSKSGNYAGAAADLEKALAFDPDNADIRNNLGAQYFRLFRYPEAEAQLKRAIELDPSSSTAHCNLAATLFARGKGESAEKEARRALELSGSNDRARFLLGLILAPDPARRAEALQNLEYSSRSVPAAKSILIWLREK
jgi:tetratricopeptide (TPR) repeat protein